MGLTACRQGLSLPETPRLTRGLDDALQFVSHFLSPLMLLLVGADGFEPPCLARPDLQSGAFDRSATHPKERDKNTRPGVLSEHPGLVAFDLSIYRLELSVSIRDASCCVPIPIVVLISKRRTDWTACGRRAEHGRQDTQGHGYRLPLACSVGDVS